MSSDVTAFQVLCYLFEVKTLDQSKYSYEGPEIYLQSTDMFNPLKPKLV
jgi:hypothetical protein